jgi:hypothetical protein
MDAKTWAYIIGGLVLLVMVVALWRRLLRAALILAGLAVAVVIAWTIAMQATATKQTATAATVSAAGSTAGNIAVLLLVGLLVLVVLIAGGYILLLRWRLRGQLPRRLGDPAGRWLPGPNAQWGRAGDGIAPTRETLGALIQLEVLRALRDLRNPAPSSLPLGYTWEDEDDGGGDYERAGDPDPLWWG